MPTTIGVGQKKKASLLDSIATVAGTAGTIANVANGASSLVDKFSAPPTPPATGAAGAIDSLTETQSPTGGTLADELAKKSLARRGGILTHGGTMRR